MVASAACLPTCSLVLLLLDRERGLHQGAWGGPLHAAQQLWRFAGPGRVRLQIAIERVRRSGEGATLVHVASGTGTGFAGRAGSRRQGLQSPCWSVAHARLAHRVGNDRVDLVRSNKPRVGGKEQGPPRRGGCMTQKLYEQSV